MRLKKKVRKEGITKERQQRNKVKEGRKERAINIFSCIYTREQCRQLAYRAGKLVH